MSAAPIAIAGGCPFLCCEGNYTPRSTHSIEMLPKYVFPFCRPFLKKGLMLETVINKGNIYTVSQNLPVTL